MVQCTQRKVVKVTETPCDRCGKMLLLEEPGSETPRWLHCHNCGQYHYFVGDVWCTTYLPHPTPEGLRERLLKVLGQQALLPAAEEMVAKIKGSWGPWALTDTEEE